MCMSSLDEQQRDRVCLFVRVVLILMNCSGRTRPLESFMQQSSWFTRLFSRTGIIAVSVFLNFAGLTLAIPCCRFGCALRPGG